MKFQKNNIKRLCMYKPSKKLSFFIILLIILCGTCYAFDHKNKNEHLPALYGTFNLLTDTEALPYPWIAFDPAESQYFYYDSPASLHSDRYYGSKGSVEKVSETQYRLKNGDLDGAAVEVTGRDTIKLQRDAFEVSGIKTSPYYTVVQPSKEE